MPNHKKNKNQKPNSKLHSQEPKTKTKLQKLKPNYRNQETKEPNYKDQRPKAKN